MGSALPSDSHQSHGEVTLTRRRRGDTTRCQRADQSGRFAFVVDLGAARPFIGAPGIGRSQRTLSGATLARLAGKQRQWIYAFGFLRRVATATDRLVCIAGLRSTCECDLIVMSLEGHCRSQRFAF
jgi:hypothetical protein